MIQGQRLADRIGVIINGRIAQVGSIHDIFYRPQGKDIARFVGIDTILKGVVESNDEGSCPCFCQHYHSGSDHSL